MYLPTKQFILVATSKNTNSFGLRNHVFIARDGSAFEAARADGDYHRRQFKVGQSYSFNLEYRGCTGLPVTVDDGFELPRVLPVAPASVVNETFHEADLATAGQ